MRWRASVLHAPSLGQRCFYGIQLLAGCLHLDSKQGCIGAVAGFLRQRPEAVKAWPPLLPRPAPPPTPCQEMLALKDIYERLMALPGLLEALMTLQG